MMSELIGVLTTACLCGMGMLLSKLCTLRVQANTPPSEYILITKEHYETLKANNAARTYTIEQPQVLPEYSEKEELIV
jgi:hypothetical protein